MESQNLTQDITELSERLRKLLNKKAELKQELKELEVEIGNADFKLQEQMTAQSITKFSTDKGTFYVQHDPYGSIENPDLAFPFLRGIGAGGLIKETVHSKALTSSVKELLENGKVSIDELESSGIKLFIKTSVRVRGRDKNND